MESSKGQRAASPKVKRAMKPNGVEVNKAELQQAFNFFDVNKRGHITMEDLKARLPIFYKSMPARELKFLMNNKQELHFNDLYELLQDNALVDFDPAAEAMKIYDPKGTGYVDGEVLRNIFSKLGFGEITDEDVNILIETADVDGDGKVSLSDFRSMLTHKIDMGVFET